MTFQPPTGRGHPRSVRRTGHRFLNDRTTRSYRSMETHHQARAASVSKRWYDIFFAFTGLLLLSPLFSLIALFVKLSDGGPVFFLQRRIGLGGKPFWIWKFRTMVVNAEKLGASLTRDRDPRITPSGRFLRKTKLDELPQLWNVLKGEMSLVGPRPEVPKYVERFTRSQRDVLQLKPGITDLATLAFRDEEELLESARDVEAFYLNFCLPKKIELNLQYARQASCWEDTKIILQTLFGSKGKTTGSFRTVGRKNHV
jgi:lipopolysaccharide/colanic/teichoic acid biosynthesis glycosyltransferase